MDRRSAPPSQARRRPSSSGRLPSRLFALVLHHRPRVRDLLRRPRRPTQAAGVDAGDDTRDDRTGMPMAASPASHGPLARLRTRANAATEAAYQYAISHPQIVAWMPCYCGCEAMDHRSNLDCYFKHGSRATAIFEEHASFCDICVEITLKAKELVAQGKSLHEIRAVDRPDVRWIRAPGTHTAQPPV